MKLSVIFENKRLIIELKAAVRVKDIINEIAKKLNRTSSKLNLFNSQSNCFYDDQDIITNTEDLEILLIEVKPLTKILDKQGSDKKASFKFEEYLKTCTDAKEVLKKSKYQGYKTYGRLYHPQHAFNFEEMNQLIIDSNSQISQQGNTNNTIRDRISELMYKFEAFKGSIEEGENIERVSTSVGTGPAVVATTSSSSSNVVLVPNQSEKKMTREDTIKPSNIRDVFQQTLKESHKQAATAKIEPDPKKLEELLFMGFDESKSKKALVISKNSLEHATELLLGGSDFELYDQINVGASLNPYIPYNLSRFGEERPKEPVLQEISSKKIIETDSNKIAEEAFNIDA